MKERILLLLFFFTVFITYGQKKIITKKFTKSHIEKLDYSKIYNKKSGQKIMKKNFIKIIAKNPNINLEKVIGENGEVEKYLLENTKQNKQIINTRKKPIKKGDFFPNFIAKTINNKTIELSKLQGKIVILRFDIEANSFRFNENDIKQVDSLINKVEDKEKNIKALIFFASNKLDIKQGFNLINSNFELIPNGINFHERYSINRFPTTIILGRKGRVLDYFIHVEDINLNKIIN